MHVVCQFSQLTQQFDAEPIFSQLSATLQAGLTGLVGRNGQGKSVLMALLAQSLPPTEGSIQWFAPFYWVQQLERLQGLRLADALGVGWLYDSWQYIQAGEADAEDLARLEDHWHLPALWEQTLQEAGLHLPLSTYAEQLSGGEQTRLALCRAFLQTDHYLLLDEPSNHLDTQGRQWLLDKLLKHPAGGLLASHDRSLLENVERILELDQHGLQEYGGNYTFYKTTRDQQLAATEQQLAQFKRTREQQKREQQASLEKAAQRRQQGENERRSGSQSTLLLDARKNRAEAGLGKLKQQHQQRREQLSQALSATQARLEQLKPQALRFATHLAPQQLCLHLADLQLPYVQRQTLTLTVHQGERWHIKGPNGSGKSTLLKVIAGLATARAGSCEVHGRCTYLDQHFSLLDPQTSALDNLKRLHPECSETQLRTELAGLRLRGDKALQAVHTLSGGERLKVALLAVLVGEIAPALLLLDEPDNHLDLDSRILLEQTLADYAGAILVVSHDEAFVEAIGVTHYLSLSQT